MKRVWKLIFKDEKGTILLEVLTSMTIIAIVVLGFASFSIISIKNYNIAFRTSKAMQSVMKKATSGIPLNKDVVDGGKTIKFVVSGLKKSDGFSNIEISIGKLDMQQYEVKGDDQDKKDGYDYIVGYSDKIKSYRLIKPKP